MEKDIYKVSKMFVL